MTSRIMPIGFLLLWLVIVFCMYTSWAWSIVAIPNNAQLQATAVEALEYSPTGAGNGLLGRYLWPLGSTLFIIVGAALITVYVTLRLVWLVIRWPYLPKFVMVLHDPVVVKWQLTSLHNWVMRPSNPNGGGKWGRQLWYELTKFYATLL